MRWVLVMIVACASPQSRRLVVVEEHELDETPPVATFRWSLDPLECEGDRDRRSSLDTCFVRGSIGAQDDHVVAVYAPISEQESRVAVIGYEGEHVGAPLLWQQHVDMGAAPHSAVVTIVRGAAVVAAISEGACHVVAIDTQGGRILGDKTIVSEGARAVQLEGASDFARIHVRTRDGGVVAVMHPRSTRVIAKRVVDEHAISEGEIVAVTPTAEQLEDISIGWENHRLVLRRGSTWARYLRMIHDDTQKPLHRASLMLVGSRAIVAVHDPEDARIEVLAFDRERGTPLWSTRVTGGSRRAFDNGLVRVELDDDQLLVYNSSHAFTCSVGLADGIERACVERPRPRQVFDFSDDQIVTP